MCQKSKNGKFVVTYQKDEHKKLLKKFKGNVSKLNKHIQERITTYINDNNKTTYPKLKKSIYISAETNDLISTFCIDKNINRAELANLIKQDIL